MAATAMMMRMRITSRALLAVLVCAALCGAPGCGCGKRTEQSDVSALRITRYRLNVDDSHRIARVMAEVENPGKHGVQEAVILASLHGPGDHAYKSGRAVVRDIPAGQARAFSVTIEARGTERDVDFQILPPDDPRAAAPVEPESK